MFYTVTIQHPSEGARTFVFEEGNPDAAEVFAKNYAKEFGENWEFSGFEELHLGNIVMELCSV